MYLTTFEVSGAWGFPTDMLRYDSCFPANSEALDALESQFRGEKGRQPRVRLCQAHPTKKHQVTIERWASFGWQVKIIDTRKV